MNLPTVAGVIFAMLTSGVVIFQLALALGAPWGEFAMGGAFRGAYPASMRVAAAVQAGILVLVALAVLSAAGIANAPWGETPAWVVWTLTGLLAVGLVLNLITPSRRERVIWAPVVSIMLACSTIVALTA